MREKFKRLPEALQKQVIMRIGAGALSLLMFAVVVILYRDLYLCLPFLLIAFFFVGSGIFLLLRAADEKVIVIEGRCSKVERTPIRKRPKVVYFTSEPYTVKLRLRQKLKNVSAGDWLAVYMMENTPIYQEEGCQVPGGYLAMELKKGSD